jgi:N-acetylglucosamine-6-phosphate deacetylase
VASQPAKLLGQEGRIGMLTPGAVADLVLLDDGLHTSQVMHNGVWVE